MKNYDSFIIPQSYLDYFKKEKRTLYRYKYYKKYGKFPTEEQVEEYSISKEEIESFKQMVYAKYCENKTVLDDSNESQEPLIPPIENDIIVFDIEEMPNDEIWYTTKSKTIYIPFDIQYHDAKYVDLFGANLVSNTYENNKGILKFDKDITKIGSKRFIYHTDDVISVYIPKSVKEWYGGINDCGIINIFFPYGMGLTVCSSFLNDCYNLEEVIIPYMNRYGNYNGTILNNCVNLRKITYLSNDYYPYCDFSKSYKNIGVNYNGDKIFMCQNWLVKHMKDITEKYNFIIQTI